MKKIEDIFAGFEQTRSFAQALGVKPSTAYMMKRRQVIPVRYWPKLVKIARRRGINIDYNTLVELHTGGRK